MATLSAETIELVAERFRALGEPARLRIMNALRGGERSVGELVDATSLGAANLSKHLQVLYVSGFVTRRKEGLYVYYALAGDDVFRLCDVMCGRIAADTERRRKALGAG